MISWFQPSGLIWDVKTGEKVIYLTFDDGPIPVLTPFVLETLKNFNAKATFFCVGENVSRFPGIYREILNQGHATGNHTFHHLNGWKTDDRTYVDDIRKCNEVLNSRLFRPPYGRISRSQFKLIRQDYKVFMWSVLSMDFHKKVTPEECLNISKKHIRPGGIIVFHDNVKASEKLRFALPRFLEHFSEKGFRFEALT